MTALRTEQRAIRRNPLLFVNSCVLPVVLLLLTLGLSPPDPERVMPVLWGVLLTALWGSTIWMAGGVLRRERTSGTLGRVVSGVHGPFVVLLGKSVGATVLATGVIAASSAGTVLILGAPVRFGNPAVVLLGVLVLLGSASTLGTLLACLFLVTRHGLAWSSTLVYPVFVLGGLLIPAESLVPGLRWVSDALNLHWVHQMLVQASRGRGLDLTAFLVAVGLAVIYVLIAVTALRLAVSKARSGGNLDLV